MTWQTLPATPAGFVFAAQPPQKGGDEDITQDKLQHDDITWDGFPRADGKPEPQLDPAELAAVLRRDELLKASYIAIVPPVAVFGELRSKGMTAKVCVTQTPTGNESAAN